MTTFANHIKHPILSKEKEKELILAYKERGDIKARDQLILHNLRFVHSIAFEYKFDRSQMDDLIQEGMKGLIVAPDKFDLEKDVAFNTCAAWWIRAAILRYIENNFSPVKLTTTNNKRRIFWNLSKARRKLEVKRIDPTTERLAKDLNVEEKEVEEMSMRMASSPISIDTSYKSEEAKNWIESLLPKSPSPEEIYDRAEINHRVQMAVGLFKETLSPMHQIILERRLIKRPPDTLQEIADEIGRSRERVRQLETRLKEKLFTVLEINGLSFNGR